MFNITGLLPNTQYFFEVVQTCDSGLVSSPLFGAFTTAELPCFTPDSLQVVSSTFNSAEITWLSAGSATTWVLAINGQGNLNRVDTVTTNPYTITGLYADAAYTVVAKAICLAGVIESDWSDTLTFTTDACTPVTGVTVSNITASTATVTWNAIPGTAGYRVSYGEFGFYETEALRAEVTTNSYTITGLDAEMDYEVYVQNKCGEGIYSVVTPNDRIAFTTNNDTSMTLYTLTVTANNAAWGTVTGSGSYPAGTQVTISATANDGYRFVQWNDGNTDNPRTVTVTANATYTATFEAIPTYMITVSANDPTMGSVTGGGTYQEGTQVTLTATPNDGYRFVQWNDAVTDAVRTITVTANADYVATFADTNDVLVYHTVTVDVNDATMGTVTGGGSYLEGSTATLTAVPNAGYRFVSWNDGETANPRTVVVNEDMSFTATFAAVQTYTVTVSSNNPAWGTVTGGGEYTEGATVTITATANAGYRFVEWNDGNTDNPRTFTVTEDVEFIATFEAGSEGIEDVEAGSLTLFPNPASSSVTVTVSGFEGEAMVELVDMNGRTVSRQTTANYQLSIDVSNLAQGAYFVRVTGNRQTAVRKLIVR